MGKMGELAAQLSELKRCGEILIGISDSLSELFGGGDAEEKEGGAGGTAASFGRIERSGVAWDDEFQVFTVNSDVEEASTRSESISLDYEFFHSQTMTSVRCGNDYPVRIIPRDINIWISRLFLGDADGFSILYYQDVDSLVHWANQAAYRWGLRGMCMWSLGQEDLRLWQYLPKQV